jgi:hypothetical protein
MGQERRREPRVGALAWIFLATLFLPARAGADARRDTSGLRLEVGLGTDFTNEQFYEDAFLDTISLGRRLVSDPETRSAGLLTATFAGTRGAGTTTYRLQNDLSLGDKIQRDGLSLLWRREPVPGLRFTGTPRLEFRKDRTFDRNLDEWRGSASLTARQGDLAGPALELGLGGDFLRTRGEGADFLLDRNTARTFAAVSSMPLFGPEWRLGYDLSARAFPDSSERDHFEHRADGRLRVDLGAAAFTLELETARRITFDPAPTSRDNFWEGQTAVEAEWRPLSGPSWRLRLEGEGIRYDVEDTTLFFDYQIARVRLGPSVVRGAWTLGAGPRGELLRSRSNPAEAYQEIGGFLEVEYLGGGLWTFAPAAGWRTYREGAQTDPFDVAAIHSSYAFYEINAFGDQPLAGTLRLHLLATGRYESHEDHSQDARSLYFSFDVRKLF